LYGSFSGKVYREEKAIFRSGESYLDSVNTVFEI